MELKIWIEEEAHGCDILEHEDTGADGYESFDIRYPEAIHWYLKQCFLSGQYIYFDVCDRTKKTARLRGMVHTIIKKPFFDREPFATILVSGAPIT